MNPVKGQDVWLSFRLRDELTSHGIVSVEWEDLWTFLKLQLLSQVQQEFETNRGSWGAKWRETCVTCGVFWIWNPILILRWWQSEVSSMSFWQPEHNVVTKRKRLISKWERTPVDVHFFPLYMLYHHRTSVTRDCEWKTVFSLQPRTVRATSNSQTALAQAAANWRTVRVLLALMTVISFYIHRRLIARPFHQPPRAFFCRSRQRFFPPNPHVLCG